jgi:hypothetical protein
MEENAPVDDEVSQAMRDYAKAQLGGAMRNSLTVARANRFVAQLPGGKGARFASQDLPIRNEDDMDDLVALLLHAESSESLYRVEVPSAQDDAVPPEMDHKLTYAFDRFFVIKK